MKSRTLSSCILLSSVAACLLGVPKAQAAVTFSVTPSTISNTYTGPMTFDVGGLTNGESVVLQEFLDLNASGTIDTSDWLIQQCQLTDGFASKIGGIVNSNVPADITPTNGSITALLGFNNNHVQSFAGKYLLKLSSPGGHFTAITNTLTVTNMPFAQGFTGTVKCSGTNVPGAAVLLFNGPAFESSLVAGGVADNTGNYAIKAPPGSYALVALKNNYLPNALTSPVMTLGSTTITTNLSLIAATSSVSGKVADAATPSLGLPGVMVWGSSDSGLFPLTFTDTNGNFSLGVTSGSWQIGVDDISLVPHGYVGPQDSLSVSAGQTDVTLPVPKATALFYGSVKDGSGNPMVGIDVFSQDSNNQYETDAYTDINGNYCAAVLGGLSNDPWSLEIDSDTAPPGYIFSQAPFQQYGGTNLSVGQVVLQNFVGSAATNTISGYLKDGSGNPIGDVWIWAEATINGTTFSAGANTDGSGHYVFNVGNGTWTVGVNCGGGDHSLGSQYLCPNSQTVTIANNNRTVNFTASTAPSQISGYVMGNGNIPIANVGVYAYQPTGGGNAYATTDNNGYYSFAVANGSWNVGVSCCGSDSLSPLGYLCIGEKSVNLNNSAPVVSFNVPSAPYQITGHLRDANNTPIPNVGIYASGTSYNACATTDANGAYTLYVNSGDWYVSVDCTTLSQLGYLCPNGQNVMVTSANANLDLTTMLAAYWITGHVKNSNNQPFANLDVYVYATVNGNYFQFDMFTDINGYFAFQVSNGQWNLGVDCGGLSSGYQCPDELAVNIAGASVVTNITIQECGQLQILTTSLPNGRVGTYYDTYLQASSCYPNYDWSLGSGSLPPGLNLDAFSGEIYGTPMTSGGYNFNVHVTDGNSDTANQPLSITIAPATPDVSEYYVMKVQCFQQIDAANLVPDTNHGPFIAKSGIAQSSLGTVPIATLGLPGGGVRAFPPGSSGLELDIVETYASQSALDTVYTNGNYTFSMATLNNGFQSPVLTMPAAAYPAAPRVSNFASAQAINPANSFTLQWTNPPDATTNDAIWVWIVDARNNMVFQTPFPPTNRTTCLRGTATSTVVPPNALIPGNTYTGVIGFYRPTRVNLTSYPGAMGVTLTAVHTAFSVVASPSTLPILTQPEKISPTQFRFLLSGATGQNYTVLVSTNPALPLVNWPTLMTTNLSTSPATIQDNQAGSDRRFYRVRVGP
jgi:hypothetical protein